ncbi:MAG: rRNA maturation RNase YbeY [Planctomycetota bacterium]
MNEHLSSTESTSEPPLADGEGEPPEPGLRVPIANEQASLPIDESRLEAAVRAVFEPSGYDSGSVSIAVVDDPTIHKINRQYLQHDYPTDVLSFVLEADEPFLEGELVVSTDTAAKNAESLSWTAHDELTLYVIHGALHLVGYRDKQPDEADEMRTAEAKILAELGIQLPSGDDRWTDASPSSTREAPGS